MSIEKEVSNWMRTFITFDKANEEFIAWDETQANEIHRSEKYEDCISALAKHATTLLFMKAERAKKKIKLKSGFNKSGSKYIRKVKCLINNDSVDVYSVLDAFEVTCPGRQHAIKKLLCAGLRKKGSEINDLIEAKDAIERAIQMAQAKLEDENRNAIA